MDSFLPAEVAQWMANLQADVQTIGSGMFLVALVILAFVMFRRTAK